MQIQCTIALASDAQTEGKVSVTPRSWLPRNNRKIYYNNFVASAELAEMSGLWNFESDPVLIRKIFENYQSDPILINPCQIVYFILLHEAKAPLKVFCLHPNMIGWRQSSCRTAFTSWGKIDIVLAFPKFNKAVSILPHEAKALLELFCH